MLTQSAHRVNRADAAGVPGRRQVGQKDRPPASMRPLRGGRVVSPGQGVRVPLAPGVHAEWLVAQATGSRNLATGLITIDPRTETQPLSHPHYASLTLLRGSLTLRTGSQRVDVRPLDNVVISPGQGHVIENAGSHESAVLHAAYPTAGPRYGAGRLTIAGAMRVTPYAAADRYEVSPGAVFIDHFGSRQIPGIRMCGGLGMFSPGARLPAHLHDFDESICIIEGTAVCWAEGEKIVIGDCATALQPRGRVHYFVNETAESMAMLWVYAGPTPQRVVVDERCATEAGFAWPEQWR